MATQNEKLHLAASENNIAEVKKLFNQGASANCLFYGRSPLDVALEKGYQELAVFLIDKLKISISRDDNSSILFEKSVLKQQWKVVRCLLAHKFNANERLSFGDSPISVAVELSCPELVRVLIDGNADVDCATYSQTPLYIACQEGETEIATCLILAGADIDRVHPRNDNFTPLIAAVANDHEEIVKLLLQNKANLNAQDADGWTSVWHAYYNSNEEICELLLKAGAKIDVPNKEGTNVVEEAYENEDDEFTLLFNKYTCINKISHLNSSVK